MAAGKSFGSAPAAPASPTRSTFDPSTSEGLANLSVRDGEAAAFAAAVEHSRRTGVPTSVTSSDGPNGERIVTRTVDRKPRDTRTERQREADSWIKEHGLEAPHPYLTRRK